MSKWSKYMQNPEMLTATRMFTLNPEFRELSQKWLKIQNNMKVLDVGCGTGEYTFYIAKGMQNCEFLV